MLVVDILLLFGFNLFLTIWPDWWPDCAVEFEIFSPPREDMRFRWLLVALAGANLLASVFCERFLADVLVTKLNFSKEKKHQEISKVLRSNPSWPEITEIKTEVEQSELVNQQAGQETVKIEGVRQELSTQAFGSLFSIS